MDPKASSHFSRVQEYTSLASLIRSNRRDLSYQTCGPCCIKSRVGGLENPRRTAVIVFKSSPQLQRHEDGVISPYIRPQIRPHGIELGALH